jgi:hypothetical protein
MAPPGAFLKGKAMTSKVEIGTHVRSKTDFPVFWSVGGMAQKVADIKEGMEGIVTGFDLGTQIVNVIDYLLPVTMEPFDEFWEVICRPDELIPYRLEILPIHGNEDAK